MKKYSYILILLLFSFSGCTLDYLNPNAAGEDELNNKDALLALAIGIQQQYSVFALDFIVFAPSLTTKETSSVLTNVANQELEKGGKELLGRNLRIIDLFSSITKVKGMAEILIEKISTTTATEGTKSGLLAWGKFFRAVTIGTLAQSWEKVPLINSRNNDANFVDRNTALKEAVNILKEGLQIISTTPPSQEFQSYLGRNIDIKNCILAYISRYQLMLGNYAESIEYANKVDLKISSVFKFDDQNQNPMFVGMARPGELLFYAPRQDFGLPNSLLPDKNDQRINFYLTNDNATSLFGVPVRKGTNSPFFATATSSIPVFLPGEITLNLAEAHLRLGNIENCLTHINKIRKKLPADDIYKLGAGLDDYVGEKTPEKLLNEIYKNRRIELFLTGLSLEDNRRFNRTGPENVQGNTSERNRNYYPYPSTERDNNKNTPMDPLL